MPGIRPDIPRIDKKQTMRPNYSSSIQVSHVPWTFILTFLISFTIIFFLMQRSMASEGNDRPDRLSEREDIQIGIDGLYNMEFVKADAVFRNTIEVLPESPIGYFYLSMVSWSRMANGFWTKQNSAEYEKRIGKTIDIAKSRIEVSGGDKHDYLYLGGALGFKGRLELMKGKWISAFFLALDAVEALKTCRSMDPSDSDVLLGLGMFDYYTARLSGVLKFISYLLIRKGGKEEGLKELNIAAAKARYCRTEAKSVLLHIYLFLEEDLQKALVLANFLSDRYPENLRYQVLKGVTLLRIGERKGYREVVSYFRDRGKEETARYKSLPWLKRALYLESIEDLFSGSYRKARAKLYSILDESDPENDPLMIAWPIIKIGMSFDFEGKRDRACDYYRQVADMENGAGAQFLAKKLLEKRPEKYDPFIGY